LSVVSKKIETFKNKKPRWYHRGFFDNSPKAIITSLQEQQQEQRQQKNQQQEQRQQNPLEQAQLQAQQEQLLQLQQNQWSQL
jgi:hypothetical protein